MHIETREQLPSKFIEDYFGLKLLPHQKFLVDRISKNKDYVMLPRFNNRKWATYLHLLVHFMSMKETDTIAVVNPNSTKKMNKDEFSKYLKDYWE